VRSLLERWLSHSPENPCGCVAVEQGTQGTNIMMALWTLRPRHWTTSCPTCGEMQPIHEAPQSTVGDRKPL
jgi:hypothetical protein